MRIIDLRSDTVTKPTPAMREAMAQAEVGDDVFGDDPTVKELEARTAELLGKEAALFVASGTMANQLALRSHTQPGDEILVEANAHVYYYEGGAPAALSGVMCRCLNGQRGIFTGADIEAALRPADPHFAPTRLVCLENTHNRGGGKIWSLEQTAAGGRHGQKAWAATAPRWRPAVECSRGFRHPGARLRRALRYHQRLLFQGTGSAGRLRSGRVKGRSSRAPGGSERCSVVACDKSASSPPGRCSRCATSMTDWPRITRTPKPWLPGSPQ